MQYADVDDLEALPDLAASVFADSRRARSAASVEDLRRQQYSPPQDFHDFSRGGRDQTQSGAALENVDYETARQVEVAEEAIASSWLSRLFGFGGFHTKHLVSKSSSKQVPAPTTPPVRPSVNHWIPETNVERKDEEGKERSALPELQSSLAQQASSVARGLSTLVPDILQASATESPEQGIVSCLGLVLRTNPDKEVIFVKALPNTPASALLIADETKMLQGDVIFAVDGEPVYKMPMNEVVGKLNGATDTVANLHFLRGNPEGSDQEQSIKEGKSRRVFATLIRVNPTDQVHTLRVVAALAVLLLLFSCFPR